ncbi:MAG: M16 family metallopeptidase [Gemmatimonadota bacterium]
MSAQTAAPGVSERLDRTVWRTVLPAGTEVLSERIDSVRSVALGIWFRQGTAHELPAERGISHLLEHMVFKGTESRSARRLALEIERLGGSLDAFTTHEYTTFQVRVPDEYLENALDVLADLSFQPALREADLELERNVVLEEIARVEDTPEELVFERHAEFLYGGHPYGVPILGTADTVGSIDAAALRRLHREAYHPGNAVVAAAGHLEHARLVGLLLPLLPPAPAVAPPGIAPVTAGGTGLLEVTRSDGRQTHIVAGALGVRYSDPLRHALILVSTALGGGMSSRLFQRIREELGLAYQVYTFHAFYGRSGHIGAYVGTQPEAATRARETLLDELERVATTGLSASEVEVTREQLRGQLHLSVESTAFRMERLAAGALHGEPYRSIEETAGRIAAISLEDANAAASLLHPDRVAVLELTPA